MADDKNKKKDQKTTPHTLLTDVVIGKKTVKKGVKHPLTEKGAKHFKSLNYIK